MKPKIDPSTVNWTRAKALHSDLKSHARRSLAGQILLGKELVSLKKKLGFTRGGDRYGSNGPNGHCVRLVGNAATWEELCISELGVSDRTVRRWIQCFQTALERSRRNLKSAKGGEARKLWNDACRLLEIPADELTGSELEELSLIVEQVAADETQASLLADLGKEKSNQVPKNPTGKTGDPDKSWMTMSVETFHSEVIDLTKMLRDIRNADNLRAGIHSLALKSDVPEELTLYKLKGLLEDLFESEVAGMLKFVEEEIVAKSTGRPPKRIRKSKARRS